MLAPAPYQVPAKEDKESKKSKGGLHSKGTLDTMSGEIGTPSFEDKREGESDIASPYGKKRTASEHLEEGAPKRGKMSLPSGSGLEDDVGTHFLHKDKPLAES